MSHSDLRLLIFDKSQINSTHANLEVILQSEAICQGMEVEQKLLPSKLHNYPHHAANAELWWDCYLCRAFQDLLWVGQV